MAASGNTSPIVWVGIGLFLGTLFGIVLVVAFTTDDTSESFEAYRERMQAQQGGAQHGAAPHGADPGGGPAPEQPPAQGHGGGPDRAQASFAKVHFMKKFLKALSEKPNNMFPSSAYETLLKDGVQMACADCHDAGSLNLEAMMRNDPGEKATESFRRDRRGFMVPLMQKWVARLNKRHGDKLRKPVECVDCHAWEPASMEGNRVLPPLMVSFVNALKSKPVNKDPASKWRPLLKDPATKAMFCATCHGKVGEMMERNVGAMNLPRPDKYADDKQFMIHLMERWVTRVNRDLKDQLVKAVACVDCHETDPRK